ncbi:MurR/RpiR family transcriptional regulator [Pseudoduganella ginsengisoli]|uniref:SIS domain-containing protein n=1 Tax=Pseudoduganella ginsengisoli TaxID=1462440 RepID=A0A6L6Q5Q9_9BURK|nr:MurR/RpiR family transcriptional regulator [Pseudoduganella ginsengisoli]MTW05213.1 SIS domain-containing protein [Pseudoduganella ginsengisoli]
MRSTSHESTSPAIAFAQSALGQSLSRVKTDGSASHKSIAEYLLRHQVRVAGMGIEELAESCAVSTATISRFARDIGFSNYAAMRAAVAEILQGVLQPVEKLRSTIEKREGGGVPAVESLEYAVANINATASGLAIPELDKIVHQLVRANTVYVMGFGLSTHLAGLLALHLQPFCPHVVEVAGLGGTEVAAGHLANITAKDVLVVISFPRYALDVIRLANFARTRDACIIALTDSPASPLADLADHVLYAQSSHSVLPSSSTAALAMIEALTVTLMVSNKENVEKAARLTEAISAYLYGPDAAQPARPRKNARK